MDNQDLCRRRDTLWDKSFDTYYDTFYYELVSEKLVYFWQLFDEVSKLIVALTASGSVITGWTLWNEPGLRNVWAIIAGFGAVLAVIHATLGVPGRLTEWEKHKRELTSLRVDIESFRYKMEMNFEFDLDPFTSKYDELRKRYASLVPNLRNDVMKTKRLEIKAQNDLNSLLRGQIKEG